MSERAVMNLSLFHNNGSLDRKHRSLFYREPSVSPAGAVPFLDQTPHHVIKAIIFPGSN